MFFYEGLSCPHCHRAFKESDDIVACPVCGAPHHRGCWGDAGGCARAADHGTPNEWSRDKATSSPASSQSDTKPCPHCHKDNSVYAEFCAHCGKDIPAQEWHSDANPPFDDFNAPPHAYGTPPSNAYHEYAPFHVQSPYGGVAPDNMIEGESARDIAATVGSNTPYYMPRFEAMSHKKSKVSMNWAAFFVTEYWLFHRKQYVLGALVMAFNLMLSVLSLWIYETLIYAPYLHAAKLAETTASYPGMIAWVTETASLHPTVMLLGLITLTTLLVKLFFGLFANSIYLQSCVKTIRRTRASYPEGYQSQLPVYGGTSFILALVMYMCANIFTNLIGTLFI